jgi:hypothetical protein
VLLGAGTVTPALALGGGLIMGAALLVSPALAAATRPGSRCGERIRSVHERARIWRACAGAGGTIRVRIRRSTAHDRTSVYDFEALSIDRRDGAARQPARQGAADRQHRQRLRLHAAVRRAREALAGLPRPAAW